MVPKISLLSGALILAAAINNIAISFQFPFIGFLAIFGIGCVAGYLLSKVQK